MSIHHQTLHMITIQNSCISNEKCRYCMNIDHFYQFAAGRRHFELPEHPFWRGSPNPSRKYPDDSVMGNKLHKFWVPCQFHNSKNTLKIEGFSQKKMPKNCRLSFHPNLILAHQTSIFIIKYEVLGPYEEASKKIAMWGNPARTC